MNRNGISSAVPDTPERERQGSESSDSEYVENVHVELAPILPIVHVSTHEEDEEEFLKIRAKLYRFDAASDPPEWKERGTGELKILRHKEKSSFRVVMRRDKTLKVCLNHYVTPMMDLKRSSNNEKAFIYSVLADYTFETTRSECFALKFATVDNAMHFKSSFEKAKEILKTDCDLYNGKIDNEIQEECEKILKEEEEAKEDEELDISKKLSELEVSEGEKGSEKEENVEEPEKSLETEK
ncbi:unnamed protein product [Ceutorhynchus assimilis]|uniref:Ran-specific GTPase-activating protein n=1 Tax=Ceutorhynchus assimilis TaxID=467358 RepID=A0A9N9QHK6_9CUCU|nr:unnamed protein product [Ceutorhynchus assimilis]